MLRVPGRNRNTYKKIMTFSRNFRYSYLVGAYSNNINIKSISFNFSFTFPNICTLISLLFFDTYKFNRVIFPPIKWIKMGSNKKVDK